MIFSKLIREEVEERRLEGEWDLTNPNIDEIGLKANALLNFLVDNQDVSVLNEEEKADIQRIKSEIDDLTAEYDNSDDVRTDLLNQIEELEGELADYDDRIDVYNIVPTGEFYSTTEFEVKDSNVDSNRYAVGTNGEMQSSCEEYVENLIDDIGYEGFNLEFAKNYLDEEAIASEAEDIYYNEVRDSPGDFLDKDDRLLSDIQEEHIEILRSRISKIGVAIEDFESRMSGEDDDEIEEKIQELKERLEEYEEEIEDIENNPDGDYPDELIEQKVSDMVSNVRRDPESFLSDFGLNWKYFVNRDDFIKGVIDEDGYGHTINRYDGTADEIYIKDQLFYVMRID